MRFTLLPLVVAGAGAAAVWAVRDYRDWRGLGIGGLPPTPAGWLTTTGLRMRGRNPFVVRGRTTPPSGELDALPRREGDRPRVAPHPVPHRVRDQHCPPGLREPLQAVFDEYAASAGTEYRTSGWEKHNLALFGAGKEFAHQHPADGSMHMVLAPADAQRVIDLGWGQLHPLAGVALGLPAGYTMIYPPRTAADIAPIRTILAAAAAATRRSDR